MGQYWLPKDKAGELPYHWVNVVTTAQDLCHRTITFVQVAGDYFGFGGPLIQTMAMQPHHIGHFGQEYEKAFSR